jgi:hypothetical protein
MKNVTSKPELSHPAIENNSHLFDDWFDPIEDMIRGQVRGLIEEMIRGELRVSDAGRARRCHEFWRPASESLQGRKPRFGDVGGAAVAMGII